MLCSVCGCEMHDAIGDNCECEYCGCGYSRVCDRIYYSDICRQLEETGVKLKHLNDVYERYLRNSVKRKNGNVVIAIYGLFGSGKSSFINRAISFKLMDVSAAETTKYVTSVRYGKEAAIHWTNDDAKMDDLKHPWVSMRDKWTTTDDTNGKHSLDVEKMRRALSDVISGMNKTTGRVIVDVPRPEMRNIVLVDTPGLDTQEEKHEIRVKSTMGEADAAIYIVDSNTGIRAIEKETLNYYASVFKRIYVVANKMDCIDVSERDEVTKEIETKVKRCVEQGKWNRIKVFKTSSVEDSVLGECKMPSQIIMEIAHEVKDEVMGDLTRDAKMVWDMVRNSVRSSKVGSTHMLIDIYLRCLAILGETQRNAAN